MKNNRKLLGLVLIIIIAIVSSIFIFETKVLDISKTKSHYIYLNDDIGGTSTNITKETTLVQEFKCDKSFSGFRIYFGQNSQEVKGNVKVTLENQKSDVIKTFEMSSSDIKTDQYNVFYLDNSVYNNCENEYKIVIRADSQDIIKSSYDMYTDGNLYINGQKQDSDICFNLISTDSHFIVYFYIMIATIVIIFIGVVSYLIIYKNLKIENIFLICSLFLGIAYMIVFTPYSISDESKHINTAYRYSNVFTFSGGYRTENGDMLKRAEDTEVFGLRTTPSLSTYYVIFTHIFDLDKSSTMVETKGETIGNIFQYIPAVVGITIARMYKLGYIPLIYIARCWNLAFFIVTAYFAIKKAPFGKMIFFITAMLPMTMQQASSCSYDAIVNGLALLFISSCLDIAFSSRKIKKLDIIILYILGSTFVAAKAGIYLFVLLLLLIIPKEKFSNFRKYCLALSGILAGMMVVLVYFNRIKIINAVTISGNRLVDFNNRIAYPFSYIIDNPIGFIKLFINTIIQKGNFYISTLIGGQLSIYTVHIPNTIVISFIILLIFSGFKKKNEKLFLTRYVKIIITIIVITVFIAFHFVALTWTPYGDSIIYGVVGRYFIAILPLIILLFRNNKIVINREIDKIIIEIVCILQSLTIISAFYAIIK